ncbi:MAG TPA: head GIN domain-containing protein [Flavobacteriales bacterium]
MTNQVMLKRFELFLSVIALMGLLLSLTSCEKRIRKTGSGHVITVQHAVDDFHELEVDGKFDVFLHTADEPKMVITTDDNVVSDVAYINYNGKLRIFMSDDYYRYKFTRMEIHLYTSNYTRVELEGDIRCSVQDTITSSFFALEQKGTGSSTVRYNGEELKLRINGSGDIQAYGETDRLDASNQGSGKISTLNTEANHVKADINGSGRINVKAIQTLQAKVNGSGKIRYTGSPVVNSSVHGSGSVTPY